MEKIFHAAIALLLIIGFFGCNDKVKQQREKEMQAAKEFPIYRFEQILFTAPQQGFKDSLMASYKEYEHMYNTDLNDEPYLSVVYQFSHDSIMRETYRRVMQRYPELNWLSLALQKGFDTLTHYYSNLHVPKVYSLIVGPNDFAAAYANRVVTSTEYLAFSIDLYALNNLSDLPYYDYYPRYMQTMLDSVYLPADILSTYIYQEIMSRQSQDVFAANSFLDEVIKRGKLLYAVQQCLPDYPEYALLRYTPDQWEWCRKNENSFWSYLLKNKMLYETDFSKYKTFVQEGGSTRGLEGSPARLGDYLGLKIVQSYAERNKATIKEILEMQDHAKLFTESNYKPENY